MDSVSRPKICFTTLVQISITNLADSTRSPTHPHRTCSPFILWHQLCNYICYVGTTTGVRLSMYIHTYLKILISQKIEQITVYIAVAQLLTIYMTATSNKTSRLSHNSWLNAMTSCFWSLSYEVFM